MAPCMHLDHCEGSSSRIGGTCVACLDPGRTCRPLELAHAEDELYVGKVIALGCQSAAASVPHVCAAVPLLPTAASAAMAAQFASCEGNLNTYIIISDLHASSLKASSTSSPPPYMSRFTAERAAAVVLTYFHLPWCQQKSCDADSVTCISGHIP